MHVVEQKILKAFAKQPGRDISTTDLVKAIFSEEYAELKNYIHNEQKDKDVVKIGKRKKARLHRKLLYHLNKLVEDGILKMTRVEGRGEKFFSLVTSKKTKNNRETIARNIIDSVSDLGESKELLFGLEDYEDAKIVKRFDTRNWITKINAFILEATSRDSLKELYNLLLDLYPVFNDAVGINDFEEKVNSEGLQELTSFLKKINIDTKDYHKYVNLIIDLSKISDSVKLSDFIRAHAELNPDRVFVIFKVTTKSIANNTRFMKQAVKSFSENKIRINLHNTDLKKAPIIIGRAGTYTFDDSEWKRYRKYIKGKTIGLCSSETSVYVDVQRFLKQMNSYSEFRDFLLKAARALLLATTEQRKKSDLYFKTLNDYNGKHQNKFFGSSVNYIRLWNYDLDINDGLPDMNLSGEEFQNFESVLKVAAEEIEEFCKTEETIFKSCGIPIAFRVVLSSAFKRFDTQFLSPRKYMKVTIKGINDLHTESIKEYLKKRELVGNIFKGGDRVRFFRAINFTADETISEFNYLLTAYKFPLISYDFNQRKGELTLDNFI